LIQFEIILKEVRKIKKVHLFVNDEPEISEANYFEFAKLNI